MDRNVAEAARLVRAYTGGTCNLWALTGSPKAGVRAHIMAALLGRDRVPQKDAGITVLREKLLAGFGIAEACTAAEYNALSNAIRDCPEPAK